MSTNQQFLVSLVVIVVFVVTGWFVYQQYGEQIMASFTDVDRATIYVGSLPIEARIADEQAERVQGLSGVTGLDDLEVLLFVFDTVDQHGIWMKDMLFAIDILWLDESGTVVHIEENVSPDTYPQVFRPGSPARYVLEGNAFFAESNGIVVGDQFELPPRVTPNED